MFSCCWGGISRAEAIEKALKILEECDYQ